MTRFKKGGCGLPVDMAAKEQNQGEKAHACLGHPMSSRN
jgi:hypothetical protein